MSFKLKNSKVIDSIIEEYAKDSIDWYMGFSGGKDSSATLKLVYTAIKKVKNHHKKIYVLFCDTGVENPIISQYVTQLFENLKVQFGGSLAPTSHARHQVPDSGIHHAMYVSTSDACLRAGRRQCREMQGRHFFGPFKISTHSASCFRG